MRITGSMITVADPGASPFLLLRRKRRVRSGKLITDPMWLYPPPGPTDPPDQQSVMGFSVIQG
jgi:hypothetical protein